MTEIEIEIDGKKLKAEPNQTVIQVADAAGIYIPRFCYHKQLTVAANCRMCLVEVDKVPKTLPACATPVTPGMKVFTKSAKTQEAQRTVMEFLLINHPLDCPICDQGGECELQDLSMGYGSGHSQYDECKRSVADEDLGPLISSDMTRCILCTRCVRFCDEIAGVREIGVTERGGHAEISTYVNAVVTSEVSGNIIDLCPVGALTSKPYRFTARAWELDQAPSISPHDGLGTNLHVHTRYGKVMRVVSRENMALNETWIADRDRFSYTGLYAPERLTEPKARIDGKWVTVEWQKAFEIISAKLQDVIAKDGAEQIGALASPSATVEEYYLLQKIIRGLGSDHIDHRLREIDTSDQAQPGMTMSLSELEKCNAILLIGSNIQKEIPLIATRIRKASLNHVPVLAVNPVDYDFNFTLSTKKIISPQAMVETLEEIISGKNEIADLLRGKQNVAVFVGQLALHHPEASRIRHLAQKIADKCGKLNLITDGANSAGAQLAGAIPGDKGLSAYEMLEKPLKAYLLLNVEPNKDFANAAQAEAALKQASFVAALSLYHNPVLEAHADVLLPMAPFTETSGTFVNMFGAWQSFKGVAKAYEASRPAWKILRVLGNFLHLDGFDYESSEEVRDNVKSEGWHGVMGTRAQLASTDTHHPVTGPRGTNLEGLIRIGEIPIYSIDSLVRHAKPLQEMQAIVEGDVEVVKLHPNTAKKFGLQDGQMVEVKQATGSARLTVKIDERIAENAVWIAGGTEASSKLGDLFGKVEISAC